MTSRADRINKQRLEKVERLCDRGVNPYPHRYRCSHTTEQAIALLKQIEETPTEEEAVERMRELGAA